MFMKKKLFKIFAAVTAMLMLCSCSDTVKDAELRCPLDSEPVTLDPQIAQGSSATTIVANCFEGLMRLNSDGSIEPAAAESVTASPDGLVYRFKLHQNKKWHINTNHEDILGEGYETAIDTAVTADDFVFALQRAIDPATKAPQASRLRMIKNASAILSGKAAAQTLGVTAVDRYTVQITLDYASDDFLQILTEPIAMPCKRSFFEATKGRYGLNAAGVLCNGSFYLSRWYSGSTIVLRRNTDNPQNAAKIYSLTFAFTTDEELKLSNLEDKTYAAAQISAQSVEAAKKYGCSITEIPNTIWAMVFNCKDDYFSSLDMRLAFVTGADVAELKSCTGMTAATTLIPPSCKIEGRPYTDISPMIAPLAYDAAKAKSCYQRATDGENAEITILCTAEFENAIRKMMQSWQKLFGVGLAVKVEVLEEAELTKRVNSGNYQCAVAPIKTQAQAPIEFLCGFENGGSITAYTSAQFEKLLSSLSAASGTQATVAACTAVQNHLVSAGAIIPLCYENSFYAINPLIRGAGITHSGKTLLMNNSELLKK